VARTQRLTVRAQENKPGEKIVEDADQYEKVPTGVDRTDTRNIEAGNLSNENAERRADIGKERIPSFPGEEASLCWRAAITTPPPGHKIWCFCRPEFTA